MAFTTVTGSNGITSLVGTTGVDTASIVTLNENVFVGGNTDNDTLTLNSGTGNDNLSNYTVRMGGGDDDIFIDGNNILNSLISLDGETLANDGDDTVTINGNQIIINSEIRGMGGIDTIQISGLSNSIVNGNSGNDLITGGSATTEISSSAIYGGKGLDTIDVTFIGAGNEVNGNKGDDTITVTGTTISSTFINGGQGDDNIILVGATIDGNTISGDNGNDTVTGSGAQDILLGGDGNDTLSGEGEADTLTGGAGTDTFDYNVGDSVVTGNTEGFDTITDFVGGTDLLGLLPVPTGGYTDLGQRASVGASLAADLRALTTLANFGDVEGITITGNVEWAGTYIVQNVLLPGYNAFDTVIAVDSIAGITDDTFV